MSKATDRSQAEAFHVPLDQHLLESIVHGSPGLWTRMSSFGRKVLGRRLNSIRVDRPIFIAGLARSGSTILREALSSQRDVGTHQSRDFQGLFTPWWWNEIQRRVPQRASASVERAHGDGLMITPESPEALEEPLWSHFFPQTLERSRSQVLDSTDRNDNFDRFYKDHLRKLLLIRESTR